MNHTAVTIPRRMFLIGSLATAALPLSRALLLPHGADASRAAAHSLPGPSLGPLINIPQTWNNCGPASIAEVVAYWGILEVRHRWRPSCGLTGWASA